MCNKALIILINCLFNVYLIIMWTVTYIFHNNMTYIYIEYYMQRALMSHILNIIHIGTKM